MDWKKVNTITKKVFSNNCEYCGTYANGNGYVFTDHSTMKTSSILKNVVQDLERYFGKENISFENEHMYASSFLDLIKGDRGYLGMRIDNCRIGIIFGVAGTRFIEYKSFFVFTM